MTTHDGHLAVRAWNLMGGEIKWEALAIVAEILGIEDIERLIVLLGEIREHQAAQASAGR